MRIRLEDLEGRWRLSREITDLRAGVTGRLEGDAVWTRAGPEYRQEESGLLHYGDAPPMQATRVYLWRETEAGLAVFFADGAPFHTLEAGEAGGDVAHKLEASHFCDPDSYVVRYDFRTWPNWESRWRVTGPRKDAVISNRFSRV